MLITLGLAIAFVISSGSLDDNDLNAYTVGVSDDGWTIKVEESINEEALDVDIIYSSMERAEDFGDADFQLRRFAMKAAIRSLVQSGNTSRMWSIDTPFRVEKGEMVVNFLATPNGGRLCHIDVIHGSLIW